MVSSNQKYRIEKDSMGSVRVPKESYYGAQTQRAVENFPVSGWRFQKEMIHALGLIKLASAKTNFSLESPGSPKSGVTSSIVNIFNQAEESEGRP